LHCVVNYPSPIEQANIRAMKTLEKTFHLPVGYSDHSPTDIVALGAVACGACMIEKHFTFDKTRHGPDHPYAMDVSEFATMVERIRLLEQALGSPAKHVVPAEVETRILQRRSVFSRVKISKGTVITPNMLTILRPAIGLEPKYFGIIVGRKAKKDMKPLEPITWDKI
jgi:N-acetylneuraminate synthase